MDQWHTLVQAGSPAATGLGSNEVQCHEPQKEKSPFTGWMDGSDGGREMRAFGLAGHYFVKEGVPTDL